MDNSFQLAIYQSSFMEDEAGLAERIGGHACHAISVT